MTTLVDLQHASLHATATSSFTQAPKAFLAAVAVSSTLLTSSVLTGGVLERDGILRAEAVSTAALNAHVVRAASLDAEAVSSLTASYSSAYGITSLSALTGLGADTTGYATSSVELEPLTGEALGEEIGGGYYSYADTTMSPLMADGWMWSGEVGVGDTTLLALQGIGSGHVPDRLVVRTRDAQLRAQSVSSFAGDSDEIRAASLDEDAVSGTTITSSVLIDGVLYRDGLLVEAAVSSTTFNAGVVRAAVMETDAVTDTIFTPSVVLGQGGEEQGYSQSGLPPGLQPGGDGSFTLGEPGSYLHPLISFGYDPGPGEEGVHEAFMTEVVFFTIDFGSSGSVYNASVTAEMTLSDSMSIGRIVTGLLEESVTFTAVNTAQGVFGMAILEEVQFTSSGVSDPLYVAWSMNVNNKASSQYTGYPFNSLVVHNGRVLAAGPGGLVEIGGDDDDGDPIVPSILLGKTDFGSTFEKGLDGVYVGIETDGDVHVKIHTDDGRVREYRGGPTGTMRSRFVKPGKGMKSRYWQAEIVVPGGEDFTLDTVELVPIKTTKRRK